MSLVYFKNLLTGSRRPRAREEQINVLSYSLHANGTLYPSTQSQPNSPVIDQTRLRSQCRTWRKTDTFPATDSEHGLTDSSSISTAVDDACEHDDYSFHKAEGEFGESEPGLTRRLDPRIISDATIGLSDGLTVPFALSAGLSAFGSTKVVIFGGIAELIAGAISMGLGGYLGAKSEAESYEATLAKTRSLANTSPHHAASLARSVLSTYNFPPSTLDPLIFHLSSSPTQLTRFLMRFYHCAIPPHTNRAYVSALTIAAGYFFGGLLPLLPYFFVEQVREAFWYSVAVMILALFAFGFGKTYAVRGWEERASSEKGTAVRGGFQMVFVGGVAAGAATGLVKAFG